MKLVEVKTKRNVRIGTPIINFNTKGAISFGKYTTDNMGLKDGDQVSFFQEEGKPKNWFVCKSESGLVVRNNSTGGMITNNISLREKLIKFLELDETENYSIPVGEPTELFGVLYYPLITAKITQ